MTVHGAAVRRNAFGGVHPRQLRRYPIRKVESGSIVAAAFLSLRYGLAIRAHGGTSGVEADRTDSPDRWCVVR